MAIDPTILEPTEAAIQRAGEVLRGGGVVGFPTETVYGLGAAGLDASAVAKVFEVKGRPRFDPLIVHVADADDARALVSEWPEAAARLAAALWPGPVTLVLARRPIVPDLVTAGLATVAVRAPAHPVARRLIAASAAGGLPAAVAAPSANRFGAISPTRAEHVVAEFAGRGDVVSMVLDGGPCDTGIESTVVSLVERIPTILRLGGVPVEAIQSIVGEVRVSTSTAAPGGARARGPGMLERHYAPRTPLRLLAAGEAMPRGGPAVGWLCFQHPPVGGTRRPGRLEILSSSGDLREAAAGLFAAMRRLDESGVEAIFAQPAPAEGLGLAINDRLRRASADGGGRQERPASSDGG